MSNLVIDEVMDGHVLGHDGGEGLICKLCLEEWPCMKIRVARLRNREAHADFPRFKPARPHSETYA